MLLGCKKSARPVAAEREGSANGAREQFEAASTTWELISRGRATKGDDTELKKEGTKDTSAAVALDILKGNSKKIYKNP